jgi:hypothetical protein
MGLPMIFVELPFLAVALFPVVLFESAIYHWMLSVPWRQSFSGTFWANLWSTFLGVPVAWFAQMIGQMAIGGGSAWGLDTPLDRLAAVTLQSAWLIPYEGEFGWMVPAAALSLMLPCFLVSVGVEQWCLREYWPEVTSRRLVLTVSFANMLSYSLLMAYWGVKVTLALVECSP